MDYATKGVAINQFTVIPAYIHATQSMMTPNLIAKAFEKTGLYPVNRSVFTLEDFAPSKASSMIAYVPNTFPDTFPSSDLAKHSDSESIQGSGSQDDDSDSTFVIDNEPDGLDDNDDASNPSVTASDPIVASPACLASGLMTALMQLESRVLHRTCSFTLATSGQSHMESLTALSLEEDSALSHEGLLRELRSVQCQLRGTYQDLGDSVSQLSAANAHCTSIHRELRFVKTQLNSTRKKREQGSKKTKVHFVTSRDLRAQFNQNDVEQQEHAEVAAE